MSVGLAGSTLSADIVREIVAIVADTGPKTVVVGVLWTGSGSVHHAVAVNADVARGTGNWGGCLRLGGRGRGAR